MGSTALAPAAAMPDSTLSSMHMHVAAHSMAEPIPDGEVPTGTSVETSTSTPATAPATALTPPTVPPPAPGSPAPPETDAAPPSPPPPPPVPASMPSAQLDQMHPPLVPKPDRPTAPDTTPTFFDIPAGPSVDHGIESSMRDSLNQVNPHSDSVTFPPPTLPNPNLNLDPVPAYSFTYPADSQPDAKDEPISPTTTVPATGSVATTEEASEDMYKQEAFAMLKFSDSYYYIRSTHVMLTRDEGFHEKWLESKRLEKKRKKQELKAKHALDSYAREPSQPSQHGDDDNSDLVGRPVPGPLSVYSEQGGAVSFADPNEQRDPYRPKNRGRRSKNNSSSNHSIAPQSLHDLEHGYEIHQSKYQDANGVIHDPHVWAQVAIHPAVPEDIRKISREHMIIRFDPAANGWQMDVIGNGAIVNEQYHPRGSYGIDLTSDDEIFITSVKFRFILPKMVEDDEADVLESVEVDETIATSPAARRLSDTIDSVDSGEDDGSDEDDEPLAAKRRPVPKLKLKAPKKTQASKTPAKAPPKAGPAPKDPVKTGGKAKGKAPAKGKENVTAKPEPETAPDNEEPQASTKPDKTQNPKVEEPEVEAGPSTEATSSEQPGQGSQTSPPAPVALDSNSAFANADPSQMPTKRKGPGRPPKNGLLSKRDDAAVKRKIKDYERAGVPPDQMPTLNQILDIVRTEQRQKDAAAKAQAEGRPPPEVTQSSLDPRLQGPSVASPLQMEGQPVTQTPAVGSPGQVPVVRAMSPKARHIAKEPSPMPPESSFTEEQLKKPTMTYIYLIDEILQTIEGGQADLQTIYDKIQKRWPYYKYRQTTNGWQSSVRHNLLQCKRFVDAGKSGKGKLWTINPDYELDAKKKKTTPPPRSMSMQMPHGMPGQYGPGYNAPFQQQPTYATHQSSGQYHSPYNNGGPHNGQMDGSRPHPNGTIQQGSYHQQPRGGSRPPSQQPPPAQPLTPFQIAVNHIVSFKTSYTASLGNTPQATETFDKALNYWSDIWHKGASQDPVVDVTQEPHKTLKAIGEQHFPKQPAPQAASTSQGNHPPSNNINSTSSNQASANNAIPNGSMAAPGPPANSGLPAPPARPQAQPAAVPQSSSVSGQHSGRTPSTSVQPAVGVQNTGGNGISTSSGPTGIVAPTALPRNDTPRNFPQPASSATPGVTVRPAQAVGESSAGARPQTSVDNGSARAPMASGSIATPTNPVTMPSVPPPAPMSVHSEVPPPAPMSVHGSGPPAIKTSVFDPDSARKSGTTSAGPYVVAPTNPIVTDVPTASMAAISGDVSSQNQAPDRSMVSIPAVQSTTQVQSTSGQAPEVPTQPFSAASSSNTDTVAGVKRGTDASDEPELKRAKISQEGESEAVEGSR